MSKITSSLPILSVIYLLNTSIIARAVARNGLPKIIGILESSRISKIKKSIGRMNLLIFMSTSSAIPRGYCMDLSASSKLIIAGFGSPKPMKLPGSFSLDGSLFNKTTEHLSFIVTVQGSSNLALFVGIFFVGLPLFPFSIGGEKVLMMVAVR
ncbi:hypothetical protein Tco_0508413 [Tanacetum coccineum]